jgi:hypothetical protein
MVMLIENGHLKMIEDIRMGFRAPPRFFETEKKNIETPFLKNGP